MRVSMRSELDVCRMLSRSRIQTLIREQYIIVNGLSARPRDAVKTGDLIGIDISETVPLDPARIH